MNKLLIGSVILGWSAVVLAADVYKESLVSSGSVACTATVLDKRQYALQCNAPVFVGTGTTATSNDFKLDTEKLYDVVMPDVRSKLCVLRALGSGTATCKVFVVDPQLVPVK